MKNSVCLVSCTYKDDFEQFSLLRASIERSPLRDIPHTVAVQTEDYALFEPFNTAQNNNLELVKTHDLLAPPMEKARQSAKAHYRLFGRRTSKLLGSLARYTHYPRWPHYTGWHTQQIAKLALAAQSKIDTVIVLDSDVIVSPHARIDDFITPDKIICLSQLKASNTIKGKVKNWNKQAYKLFEQVLPDSTPLESYFDTPFVFHAPTVREMIQWLESRYQRPWWQTLIKQPARRWSEFATYRAYVRFISNNQDILWKNNDFSHYIFDARDTDELVASVQAHLNTPTTHYITVHSQASGRQKWDMAPRAYTLTSLFKK